MSDNSNSSNSNERARSLTHLLETDVDLRDEAWEREFLEVIARAPVRVVAPNAIEGPDHWPYLQVSTQESTGDADDTMVNVVAWLSTRGIGLVLNAEKPLPDYVFTYGMLWNYCERGQFLSPSEAPPANSLGTKQSAARFSITPGQQLFVGPPSLAHVPSYVRAVLKQFFRDQGVFTPKFLMISSDNERFDLCFSLESLKSPPAHEHSNIIEAISWFFPAHYSLALVSEKMVAGFVEINASSAAQS
jgi:hypothetical protein